MLVERAAQWCCYLQWESPPASRQQTIFPASLRCRCQARRPRIVVVRQRFHDGSHVLLEPHQSGIITSSSSEVKHVIPVGRYPPHGHPEEPVDGTHMLIPCIGCVVRQPYGCARCQKNCTGHDHPLVLSEPELHGTRRGKGIPQGEEVAPRLSRHTKLFAACEQVQSIEVLHLRTVLRHASMHA